MNTIFTTMSYLRLLKKPLAVALILLTFQAFEVQNRLLEKGDALSLTNVETLEFEALSEDGIILVMEVGHTL